jgi:hypothetical protein
MTGSVNVSRRRVNEAALGMVASLVLSAVAGCEKSHWEGHEAAKMAAMMNPPLHFLLQLDGYTVTKFSRNSEMFTQWGFLTLERAPKVSITEAASRQTLLRLAKRGGWETQPGSAIDLHPNDLDYLEVTPTTPVVNLGKDVGRNPKGTHYRAMVWLLNGAQTIQVAYRVESN